MIKTVLAAVVCAVVCVSGLYLILGHKPDNLLAQPPIIVTKPVYITAPAVIETLFVAGEPHEIARLDTTITNDHVAVDLGIRYDETDNRFDTRVSVTQTPIIVPPKLFRLATAVDIGWDGKEGWNPQVVGIGAGVKIREKYSIMGTINTQGTYGIRFGVDL